MKETARERESVPARRMLWVTWVQQRGWLGLFAALLGLVCVLLLVDGLRIRHAIADGVAACLTGPSVRACNGPIGIYYSVADQFMFLRDGMQVIPGLIGMFLGAPILAQEHESGTWPYLRTQEVGVIRWLSAKIVVLGVTVVLTTGAVGVLFDWTNSQVMPGQLLSSVWGATTFDLYPLTFAGWSLAVFVAGVAIGGMVKRVLPAMVMTLAVYGVAFFELEWDAHLPGKLFPGQAYYGVGLLAVAVVLGAVAVVAGPVSRLIRLRFARDGLAG